MELVGYLIGALSFAYIGYDFGYDRGRRQGWRDVKFGFGNKGGDSRGEGDAL